jgi:hypothetical protein
LSTPDAVVSALENRSFASAKGAVSTTFPVESMAPAKLVIVGLHPGPWPKMPMTWESWVWNTPEKMTAPGGRVLEVWNYQ